MKEKYNVSITALAIITFALVILAALSAIRKKKVSDLELKAIKHELNQELTKRNLDAAKHKGIMNFIKYYMNFENPKMMITFDKELQTLTGRTTPMGTEEYLLQKREAKGRHDEALEIARELKKEGLAIEFIAKTTKLSIKEIEEL